MLLNMYFVFWENALNKCRCHYSYSYSSCCHNNSHQDLLPGNYNCDILTGQDIGNEEYKNMIRCRVNMDEANM